MLVRDWFLGADKSRWNVPRVRARRGKVCVYVLQTDGTAEQRYAYRKGGLSKVCNPRFFDTPQFRTRRKKLPMEIEIKWPRPKDITLRRIRR